MDKDAILGSTRLWGPRQEVSYYVDGRAKNPESYGSIDSTGQLWLVIEGGLVDAEIIHLVRQDSPRDRELSRRLGLVPVACFQCG